MTTASPRRCAWPTSSFAWRGTTLKDTYLNIEKIIAACKETGARGRASRLWLSFGERRPSLNACAPKALPSSARRPEHISAFGLKHTAREIAKQCGVPLLPGSGILESVEHARFEAAKIDLSRDASRARPAAAASACSSASSRRSSTSAMKARPASRQSNFGDGRLYLERFVPLARHVEVQIFGDGKGGIVALGAARLLAAAAQPEGR